MAWMLFSPKTKAKWKGQMRKKMLLGMEDERKFAETAETVALAVRNRFQRTAEEEDDANASTISRLEALRGRCEDLEGFLTKQHRTLHDMSELTLRR